MYQRFNVELDITVLQAVDEYIRETRLSRSEFLECLVHKYGAKYSAEMKSV
jgi:metal-responsive CopG/Arc/MetJ family transcriptional regulator